MNILLCAATRMEIAPTLNKLQTACAEEATDEYSYGAHKVSVLITGVGLPLTAFALGHVLATHRFDLAIQAGIAGALDRELALGTTVLVTEDRFADLGVEEADGRFTSVFDLRLIEPEQAPFRAGRLHNESAADASFLPTVRGISVNRVHGYPPSITQLYRNYPDAQVESMEGAAFFYACLQRQQPCLQLRSISNYVEARNRDNWQIGKAIESLNGVLWSMLDNLLDIAEPTATA